MKRANTADKTVTYAECLYLKRNLASENILPSYCETMINKARSSGVLARRTSKIGKVWDLKDGHGVRTVYHEDVGGGVLDNVQDFKDTKSVQRIIEEHKAPETVQKMRRLQVRMASKGAINIPDLNPADVEIERKQSLVRRATRRAETFATQKKRTAQTA